MFTSNRKQRLLASIVTELCDFINKSTLPAQCLAFLEDPIALVGRQVKQRFQDEESGITTWYCGTVIHQRGSTVLFMKETITNIIMT